jgi:hypothetical protein
MHVGYACMDGGYYEWCWWYILVDGGVKGVQDPGRVLSFLPVAALQQDLPQATRDRLHSRHAAAHSHSAVRTKPDQHPAGASHRLWLRLGGTLRLREEQTGHLQVSLVQPPIRFPLTQGNTDRCKGLLMV